MKLRCRILCALLTLSTVLLCFSIIADAYSYTENSSNTSSINPTKANFTSAQSPVWFAKSETITNSVSSAKSVDIFHYEAPKNGYYMIYTSGSTDTIGKLFEENSTLWWNVHYDEKKYNDDSGVGLNFKIIEQLDKNEDYFVCVRGYGSKTGDYTLTIAPNKDEKASAIGGVWTNDNPANSAVESKNYLTAEQVKEYYQELRHEQTQKLIRNAYKQYGALGTHQALLQVGATSFTVVSAAGVISGPTGVCIGIAVSITLSALDKLFQSFYEDVDSITEIMNQLQDVCGCDYNKVGHADVYETPRCGICITHTKNWRGVIKASYTAYSSSTLYGEEYYIGTWGD